MLNAALKIRSLAFSTENCTMTSAGTTPMINLGSQATPQFSLPFTQCIPAVCLHHCRNHPKSVCLKMLCTPLYPMVLLIIIPMKKGYFIGNINPTFSDKPKSVSFHFQTLLLQGDPEPAVLCQHVPPESPVLGTSWAQDIQRRRH